MKNRRAHASLLLVILVSGITYSIYFHKKVRSGLDGEEVQSESRTAFGPSLSSRGPGKPGSNAESLRELEKSWRELYLTREARNGLLTEEHRNLALASVELLGCSTDLFFLIDFVNAREMPGAQLVLEEAAKNLLQDPNVGSELRNSLLDSIRLIDHDSLEQLCFFAATGCGDSDVGEFISKIDKPSMRKSAELGWGFRLAQSDFPAGLEYTLDALRHSTSSVFDSQALVDVVRLVSEKDGDYQQIYEKIESSNIKSDKRRGQIELVRHWASDRPEDVAGYLMGENADVSYLSVVSEVYLKNNPVDAVDWVQDLPAGKYRDHAILAQIIGLTNDTVSGAPQLADLVVNPKIKKQCLSLIDQVNRGPESK